MLFAEHTFVGRVTRVQQPTALAAVLYAQYILNTWSMIEEVRLVDAVRTRDDGQVLARVDRQGVHPNRFLEPAGLD